LQPRHGKWLTSIGQGVQQIRIAHTKEAYRVIYVAIFSECVYVLHAFHKKSKTGIETPQEELDLAGNDIENLLERGHPHESQPIP
jgi:phage-related protein